MKKILYILILIVAVSSTLKATHIVGGEFEIREKRGGLYDIYLNIYFDEINGNKQAIDDPISVAIYDKATHTRQQIVRMTIETNEIIPYENPDCAIDQLATRLLRYKNEEVFQFSSNYKDSKGYYIVYERCCRNNIIDNIFTPENVGMLFYLHFPAIYKSDGTLTGYSSPVFNKIETRYACLNENFRMDFGATDIDGDELVYSMSNPTIGFSNSDFPVVEGNQYRPEPYPVVNWKPTYNKDDAIHGTPPLHIDSKTGELKIHATLKGLFVYSVLCEEFRNGIKIGEVKRDFQILVAPCDPNEPPTVEMENENGTGFYLEKDTIFISNDGKRCFEFFITDDKDFRNNEQITVSIEPLNFESKEDFNLNNTTGLLGGVGDTLKGIKMCWPECEFLLEEPYKFHVIVLDDGCILPKEDTILVTVLVEPEENNPPTISWTNNGITDTTELNIDVFVDSLIEIEFTGIDLDVEDTLFLGATPLGTITKSNMQFTSMVATGGSVEAPFSWSIDCDFFKELDENIPLYFYVEDNSCYGDEHRDSILVNFELKEVDRKIGEFLPANIFTPNNDGKNDLFIMPKLPKDGCEDVFVTFEVYNRWGRKVYEDEKRNFTWDGVGVPDGVYYYLIKFEQLTYKGYVSILR